jgi:YebC/PmpR family DNA-binding regulatory protein
MSGHNKWSKIKHVKGAADAKKGALFTKLGNLITAAARDKGGDPETNFALRLAIDRAKKVNLPKENITRAIKRGTGELAGEQIEEIVYEGFGSQGVAIIVEALTDNKNRAVAGLRKIFSEQGGSLGEQNSVKWMFSQKGVIRIAKDKLDNLEKIELSAIDLGASDIKAEPEGLVIFSSLENLEKIKKGLEEQGLEIDQAGIEWLAKDPIKVEEKVATKVEEIFKKLEENPDVNDYYSNIE